MLCHDNFIVIKIKVVEDLKCVKCWQCTQSWSQKAMGSCGQSGFALLQYHIKAIGFRDWGAAGQQTWESEMWGRQAAASQVYHFTPKLQILSGWMVKSCMWGEERYICWGSSFSYTEVSFTSPPLCLIGETQNYDSRVLLEGTPKGQLLSFFPWLRQGQMIVIPGRNLSSPLFLIVLQIWVTFGLIFLLYNIPPSLLLLCCSPK